MATTSLGLSLAEDVLTVLHDAGLFVPEVTGFVGALAEALAITAPIVTVIDTPGSLGVRVHGTAGDAYERPTVQVTVRALGGYRVALRLARLAANAIGAVRNQEVGGTTYQEMRILQPPFDLGPDTSGRARAAFNVQAWHTARVTA